jgi:hypothetical protein
VAWSKICSRRIWQGLMNITLEADLTALAGLNENSGTLAHPMIMKARCVISCIEFK